MKLNQTNIIELVEKSLANTAELIQDAFLLESNNRLPRAYTLYQLAIEEMGKALSSIDLLINNELANEQKVKKFTKDFYSHKIKTYNTIGLDIFLGEITFKGKPDEAMNFIKQSEYEYKNINLLNDYKNYSLYTSYFNGSFKNPSEIIKTKDIERIRFRAETRFNVTSAFWKVMKENMDEMIKYLQENPVEKMNLDNWADEFWNNIEETDEPKQ